MEQVKALTPRQLERHKRVLECTRTLLAEVGYEGLQMRLVAEQSGVSPMTIYNRFGTKDDLILIALRELLAELGQQARRSGKKGIDFIVKDAQTIATQILQTPKYAKAMGLMLFNGQSDSPIVRTLLLDRISLAKGQVEEMQAMGQLNESINTSLLARNLGVCGWSTILLWMKGEVSDASFKKEYTRAPLFVLVGAMKPTTRRRFARDLK